MSKKIALISGISRSAVRSSASLAFVVGATAVFLTAAGSALWHQPVVSAAVKTPAFGREVIVDHQRLGGEPSISIDSQDRVYVAAPFGFSTTASYVWRSTDHGQSFHLVPGDLATFGKPTTCVEEETQPWQWTASTASTSPTCRALPM